MDQRIVQPSPRDARLCLANCAHHKAKLLEALALAALLELGRLHVPVADDHHRDGDPLDIGQHLLKLVDVDILGAHAVGE
eukprot:10893409-Alexandrium_andersonii.AAC.1